MKKIVLLGLATSMSILLACPPMQGAMCDKTKGSCDSIKSCKCQSGDIPAPFMKLSLSEEQKTKIRQLKEEARNFHQQQHEKMLEVLTSEQRDMLMKMKGSKGMCKQAKTPVSLNNGMGCKNCK